MLTKLMITNCVSKSLNSFRHYGIPNIGLIGMEIKSSSVSCNVLECIIIVVAVLVEDDEERLFQSLN